MTSRLRKKLVLNFRRYTK